MLNRSAAFIACCSLIAAASLSVNAQTYDPTSTLKPLRVFDAAGHVVGRLYGRNDGDYVVFEFNKQLYSLKVEGTVDGNIQPAATSNIFYTGLRCGGGAVVPAVIPSGVPGTWPTRGYRASDGRFIAVLPTSNSVVTNQIIYSQTTSVGVCQQTQPTPALTFPSQLVPLDSYFTPPFRVE